MATQEILGSAFRALHEPPNVFVIPNPWDIGSARILEGLGFEALATTSSGFAHTIGRDDGAVTLDETLDHCRALAEATSIPISADLENCFGDSPQAVASCIRQVAETGVVGGSVEDFTGDRNRPIYDFNLSVERVAAAVEAAKAMPFPFTLTARAENLLRAEHDLDETLRRLQAYEAAGADVLYAPALKTLDEVRLISASVSKPVNVLAASLKDHSIKELAEAGATRISIGGALARLMVGVLMKAADEMRDKGTFSWLSDVASNADIKRVLNQTAPET